MRCCLFLAAGWLSGICLLSAQNSGTPLPGLSDTRPADPQPASPAPKAPDEAQLRKLAGEGNAEARLALAEMILSGTAKPRSPDEAFTLLEQAADAGHPPAQYALARALAAGLGDRKPDPERSKFVLQQAAEAGFAPAQAAWGSTLEASVDLKSRNPDLTEAIGWYQKAAAQRDPSGMYRLGWLTMEGMGLPKDPAAGLAMLREAAEGGSGLAMNEVGICYQNGHGTKPDPTAAIGWFTRALQARVPAAAVNLGLAFEKGIGVAPDDFRAGASYAEGVRMDYPVAAYYLARLYEHGRGTPADLPRAWVLYDFAAATVPAAAAARDKLNVGPEARRKAAAQLKLGTASNLPSSSREKP